MNEPQACFDGCDKSGGDIDLVVKTNCSDQEIHEKVFTLLNDGRTPGDRLNNREVLLDIWANEDVLSASEYVRIYPDFLVDMS